MALVAFDFDKKLTEDQNTIGLVPKETKDDKIDFLKQFQEYWEFEKAFKYNSTFDTTFNKVISQTGLDRDQANEILEDLIGVIVGKAAEKIGLKWQMINDENYLFGFYKADGPSNLPVVLVPHKFKFSQVKEKLLDWLIAQKKNQHKKPKMQVVESLSKRTADKARDKEVLDAFPIDEEIACQMIEKFFTSTWPASSFKVLYNPRVPQFNIDSFIGYNSGRIWGELDRGLYFMKIFSYISEYEDGGVDYDNSMVTCLGMKFTDTTVKLSIIEMKEYNFEHVELSPLIAKSILGGDGVTVTASSIESLMSILSFCSDHSEEIQEVYDPKRLKHILNSKESSLDDCLIAQAEARERILGFFEENREEIVSEYRDNLFPEFN